MRNRVVCGVALAFALAMPQMSAALSFDYTKACIRQLDEDRQFPDATFRIRQTAHGLVEKSFAVSEGQCGVIAYVWKRPDGCKTDRKRVSFRIEMPAGFAFVDASFAEKGTIRREAQADGSEVVTFKMSLVTDHGPFKDWNSWFLLGVLVRCTGKVGASGMLSFTALLDGKEASNVERTRLFAVPRIRAVRPKRYLAGFHTGGWYGEFPHDASNREFARLWGEAGVGWVICNHADQNLYSHWRANGVKRITPDFWWVANGFRVGNSAGRPESDRFVLSDTNKPPSGIRHAVCPKAVYDEHGFFLTNSVPQIAAFLKGADGLWANWEPEDYRGRGCACAACMDEAREAGVPLPEFRARQQARVVKTVDRYVRAATGGERSVGFIPGINYAAVSSDKYLWANCYEMRVDFYGDSIAWINPWGPYLFWDTRWAYDPAKNEGALVNQFVAARDVRADVDRTYPVGHRPKLMAFQHANEGSAAPGNLWLTQPEWLEISMDAHFFNRWESSLLYYFPRGYDARYWRAFASHVTRAAACEDFVWDGRRIDAEVSVTVTPGTAATYPRYKGSILQRYCDIPLLQSAAYEWRGERLVAVFNFRNETAVDFDLAVKGLAPGSYRVSVEGETETRTFSAGELAAGVRFSLAPSRCRVWRIAPVGQAAAKVSEAFGYDPADATRFLQAALDSPHREIVVDAKGAPWVARPLVCRSEKTVVFEEGAWICAKRGAFKGSHDTLLTFRGCTNVTVRGGNPRRCGFRMWRDDYDDPSQYRHSEWRHAIALIGCADVTLQGISANESGGDGLYIAPSGTERGCRNVTVRNCIFDRNYRQGISVIGVEGLLVEATELTNTKGTPPQAGIDFEPNSKNQTLRGIVVRRCLVAGNEGKGFDIAHAFSGAETEPVEMLFEDCRVIGNRAGFAYGNGGNDPDVPSDCGSVTVRNCSFADHRMQGVQINKHYNSGGRVVFENCSFENCWTSDPSQADISLSVVGHDAGTPDEVVFRNVTVRQPRMRSVLVCKNRTTPCRGRPTVIDGEVKCIADGKETLFHYDDIWRKATFPFREVKTQPPFARVPAPLDNVVVTDRAPGEMLPCSALFVRAGRGALKYVFYATKPGTVRFRFLQTLIGKNGYDRPKPITVMRYGSPVAMASFDPPRTPDGGEVAFDAPAAGFYHLAVATKGNGMALVGATVPVALDSTRESITLVGPGAVPNRCGYVEGRHRVWVCVKDGERAEFVATGLEGESVGVEVFDPDGTSVAHFPSVCDPVRVQPKPKAGIWAMDVFKPAEGVYEDHCITVRGVPGWLFVCKGRYWS